MAILDLTPRAGTVAPAAVARITRGPWLAASIALVAFIAMLAFYAHAAGQASWEADVLRAEQALSPPGSHALAEGFTIAGDSWLYLLILVVGAPVLWRLRGLSLAGLLVAAYLLRSVAPITKDLVGRPRPSPELVDVADRLATPAFPSGHVLSATLIFGCLLYAVDLCVPNMRLRRSLQAGMVAIIGLMGLARMELGEHWLTDVLGGWAIGVLLLIALTQAHRAFGRWSSARARVTV